MPDVLDNETFREEAAAAAYYRDRATEAAVDAEHDDDEWTYWCMSWESLSEYAKRPYRIAVAETCDRVASAVG